MVSGSRFQQISIVGRLFSGSAVSLSVELPAVDVDRGRDVRVPHHPLDAVDVSTLGDEHRAEGVTAVVQFAARSRDAGSLGDLGERETGRVATLGMLGETGRSGERTLAQALPAP